MSPDPNLDPDWAKNRAAMEAAWNDDARIEKMIYELNFGAFSKERLV